MIKPKLSNCLILFFASAFQAFGMYNIHAVADITEGGVLGVTLLLEYWLGISPAISSFLMNAACFALGWKTLGKPFIVSSLIAACGYSVGYGICELSRPCGRRLPVCRCSAPCWGHCLSASVQDFVSVPAAPPAATMRWP